MVDARAALADVALDGAPPAALPGGCGVPRFLCAREALAPAPLPGRDHVAAPYASLRRLRHGLLRDVLGRVLAICEGPALRGHPGVHVLASDPAHRDDAPVAVLVALLARDGARADAPGERAGGLVAAVELPSFSGQFRAVVPSPEVGDSRWT